MHMFSDKLRTGDKFATIRSRVSCTKEFIYAFKLACIGLKVVIVVVVEF